VPLRTYTLTHHAVEPRRISFEIRSSTNCWCKLGNRCTRSRYIRCCGLRAVRVSSGNPLANFFTTSSCSGRTLADVPRYLYTWWLAWVEQIAHLIAWALSCRNTIASLPHQQWLEYRSNLLLRYLIGCYMPFNATTVSMVF